ncbi:hypothetical protein ACH5RR_003240 [Cinchona calisaya]|uniref:Uncharacterized protein n=1 Tax=Cinchona calisaya TaxID=153742 RepID=A0ABD3AU90_9GENT
MKGKRGVEDHGPKHFGTHLHSGLRKFLLGSRTTVSLPVALPNWDHVPYCGSEYLKFSQHFGTWVLKFPSLIWDCGLTSRELTWFETALLTTVPNP